MRALGLITAAMLLGASALAQAAAAPVSPAAGSDAVLALHPAPAGELRLEYRQEVKGSPAQTLSVGISDGYHYVDGGELLTIHDYALRRIFRVREKTTFMNESLYAEVWYRVMELRNRLSIAQMLAKGGVQPPGPAIDTSDPFWIESDLGVVSPEAPQPDLQRVDDPARVRWLLKGEELAAVRYDSQLVPAEIRGRLRRFWPTFTQLHPQIAEALASSGRMPADLWVKQKAFGKEPAVTHWRLVSSRWEPAARYPLPAGLAAHPDTDTGAYPEIFATLAEAVAQKRVPPAPDVYVARANEAIGRGAGLEAISWLIEMSLAQGRPAAACQADDATPRCVLLRRAGSLARTDPRTAIASQKKSPDEADRPQFDSLPNAYLWRLLWATRPAGKGVTFSGSERDLLGALKSSPVANFCKDTGDFYAQAWQPFAAWQVWDLGRAMAGHTQDDLLASIDRLEGNIASDAHILF
jgi:hypothetical protein